MKQIASSILLLLVMTGCKNRIQQNEIVKETYIHRYGVPISKSDWLSQGKEGQTVSLRADGTTVTTSYLSGIMHGPTTYSFPHTSTIQMVENYSQGELISKKEHFASGMPMKEEVFENGELVHFALWYEDGTPKVTEDYSGDFLVSGEYRNPLNVLEGKVQNGEGIRIWRSNDGTLLLKDQVSSGYMTERTAYFANGEPSTITHFEKNQIHGIRRSFSPGGVPLAMEEWVHGNQEGLTSIYQNGEKFAQIPYKNGKKEGIERRYRDGSILAEEICWKEDLQHGHHKLFIDGETKAEWYHQGHPVSQATFERMNYPLTPQPS